MVEKFEESMSSDDSVISQEITEMRNEIAQLKDLFIRRLLEDRDKSRVIGEITARLDNSFLKPMISDVILLLDRVLAHGSDDFSQSIADEMLAIYSKYGLELVSSGSTFCPKTQKIVGIVESLDHKDGEVASVQRAGYLFNERVFRPEEVFIYKQPAKDCADMPSLIKGAASIGEESCQS